MKEPYLALLRRGCVFLLTTLFMLSLLWTTIEYAKAQSRGGGSGGGPDQWVTTYSCSGTGNAYRLNLDGTREGNNVTWNGTTSSTGEMASNYKLAGAHDGGASSSGTITATLTWLAADGVSPAKTKPLAKIYLLESTSALFDYGYGDATSSTVSASVDDGMNDPQVESVGITYSSSGKHLVQADGSSGVITRSVTMSASGSITDTQGLGNEYVASCEFIVSLDPRAATIYCAELQDGGNFHKGANNTLEANVDAADGSVTVDTVMGPQSLGGPIPLYDWYLKPSLNVETLGFDMTTTDPFFNLTNTSIAWNAQSSVGAVSLSDEDGVTTTAFTNGMTKQLIATMTINVKVTDLRPNLSATADNTYTIRIHKPIENVVKTTVAFDHFERYPWTVQVPANDSTNILMVSVEARHWSLLGANGWQVGGAIAAGLLGSGAAALVYPLAPPAAFAIADMAFNAIGWVMIQAGTPDATKSKNVVANWGAYTNAIAEQKNINAQTNDVDFPTDSRIIGVSFALVAANPKKYWDLGIPRGRCHGGTRNIKYTEFGDSYGPHGYTGNVTLVPGIFDRYVNDVWEWTVNAVQ